MQDCIMACLGLQVFEQCLLIILYMPAGLQHVQ